MLNFIRIIPVNLGLLAALALIASPLLIVADAGASDYYLCQKNEKGRVRVVDKPSKCKKNERAIALNPEIDLSDLQDQIDGLDDRLWALEGVPKVVAAPLQNLVLVGETATGCDIAPFGSPGASPLFLIAECLISGPGIITTRSGHGARIRIAGDSDYVYDGIFICLTIGDAAIAREDGVFLDTLRVQVTPLNLEGDPQDGTLVHIRSTGSTPTVRTLFLNSVDENLLAEPVFTEPQLPCQTFYFADGSNFSNPQFEFDTWSPPGELELYMRFPTLDGRDHTNPTDGDQVRIYQLGLTVAGRRNHSE